MGTILVIDDEKDFRESIVEILQYEGFKVSQAKDGKDGIAKALTIKPDLILCDIRMPVIGGFEVVSLLRKDISLRLTPFIFITALAERSIHRKGIELGADDFLVKPFTRQELLNAISIRIQRSESFRLFTQKPINILKNSIVRALPHEFRTSLNSILGFSKIISEDVYTLSSQEILEMAQLINNSGEYLFEIITKYLLYIELKTKDISYKKNQCITNIEQVIQPIALKIAEKHDRPADLQLSFCKVKMNTLTDWFSFAVRELLDNAFKFSSKGQQVTLASERKFNRVYFTIKDEGYGFPPEYTSRDIDAFLQFDRDQYEQQGVGLGLYLAREIIKLHNGNLEIVSSEGEGTTISFDLPQAT